MSELYEIDYQVLYKGKAQVWAESQDKAEILVSTLAEPVQVIEAVSPVVTIKNTIKLGGEHEQAPQE